MRPHLFGLEPRHFEILSEILINPLHAAGCKVFIFGSRARGDHRAFSDIDILIDGDAPQSLVNSIEEQLDDSQLPIRVDLVQLKDLAESYRTGALKDRIEIH
jgi:predicted nucleotidyltransferase